MHEAVVASTKQHVKQAASTSTATREPKAVNLNIVQKLMVSKVHVQLNS